MEQVNEDNSILSFAEASQHVSRYCLELDKRNWDAFLALFSDDVTIAFAGVSEAQGKEALSGFVKRVTLADQTQHLFTTLTVEPYDEGKYEAERGNGVSVEVYGVAVVVRGEKAVIRGLSYTFRMERQGVPKITYIEQRALWSFEADATQNPGALFAGEWPADQRQ